MRLNKENFFISRFENRHIGDDGAVINQKKGKWVYSSDSFFEDVHFKLSWMSLEQIATKAMLVNISDAIVMNAKPKYALLNIAIPPQFDKTMLKNLSRGFNKTAKKFAIKIIGGDTISNSKLCISITLISKTKNPIYRHGANIGDIVFYTGDIGLVQRDLEKLKIDKPIDENSKFIKPQLKADFFYGASKYISSAIDISDGLGFELQRLSSANNIAFRFIKKPTHDMLCSGEEYEILFTVSLENQKKVQLIAKQFNTKINKIAVVVDGTYKHDCEQHHF